MTSTERGKCSACLYFTFNYETQRCDDKRCISHFWREERTCKRCGTEYEMGCKAANSPCPNDACREAEFARRYAPPVRTVADVEREYEDACTALSSWPDVAGLVWEYLKANPKASTTEAEQRALEFITWRTEFVEAAEARVDRLNAERKAMSK